MISAQISAQYQDANVYVLQAGYSIPLVYKFVWILFDFKRKRDSKRVQFSGQN